MSAAIYRVLIVGISYCVVSVGVVRCSVVCYSVVLYGSNGANSIRYMYVVVHFALFDVYYALSIINRFRAFSFGMFDVFGWGAKKCDAFPFVILIVRQVAVVRLPLSVAVYVSL